MVTDLIMTNDLTFKTNVSFISANYDKDGDSWIFLFDDKIWAVSSGFWRILVNNKISIVSSDHGHQFGLPRPLNLEEEIRNLLSGKTLTQIQVDNDTADLILLVTGDIKIEIFISSTGYETHEFSVNNKRYIGLGAGDIAILDN